MTFFGIDEDKIVRELMPELQRVTTSFEWLMHVLAWSIAIHLMIHIWRQWKNNKRASEIQARIAAKELDVSSAAVAASEVEHLIKENEALGTAVRLQRRAVKQRRKNKELKNLVVAGAQSLRQMRCELMAREDELRQLKDTLDKVKSTMSSVETVLQCQVCMELLHRPYILSSCGHVFCPHCLQEWFRKAPTASLEHDILERPKFCPVCRTRITNRPIPIFVLREVIDTLVKLKLQLVDVEPGSPATDIDGDPWEGMFLSEDEEDY